MLRAIKIERVLTVIKILDLERLKKVTLIKACQNLNQNLQQVQEKILGILRKGNSQKLRKRTTLPQKNPNYLSNYLQHQ